MLQQMRDWFRYLKWLLLIIIAMFLWWAVNVWGGGMSGRAPTADWAAKINGTEIPVSVFQMTARQLESTYQSILGEQYAQQRAFIRLGTQAIDSLVNEELSYQEAVRQGISISPQELAESITRDPSFQVDGRFVGVDRYRNLFRSGRMTVQEFEDLERRRLIVAKFRSLVEDGVSVGDAEVREEFDRRNVKETVEYLLIDPGKVETGAAPKEADIAAFYNAHLDRYNKGEGRSGIYVLLGGNDLAAQESVTEDEIKAAYNHDLSARYTLQDQRRASHILFKIDPSTPPDAAARIESKARGVLKRARAGEDFAALARAFSEDSSSKSGGDLDFFSRGQMVKPFEDAAFALPVGGISDLVRTSFGFHIIKVTGARPGRIVPLEEARASIREELKSAKAREEGTRRAGEIARTARGGKLDVVARSQGLTVSETGPVFEGEAVPGLAASNAVVARMMSLTPGAVSDPIAVPSGQVVVQVTATVPAHPASLKEVHQKVEKDLRDERARVAVAQVIRAIPPSPDRLKVLGRKLKSEIKTQADLSRASTLQGVSPDPALDRQLWSLATGVVGDPLLTTSGIVVLNVRERRDHREEFDAQKTSIRDNLVRQRQDRVYRALLKRLRDRSKVVLNDAVVRSVDRS
jgi:peptidyl-prolyl cis-trans isomerase D